MNLYHLNAGDSLPPNTWDHATEHIVQRLHPSAEWRREARERQERTLPPGFVRPMGCAELQARDCDMQDSEADRRAFWLTLWFAVACCAWIVCALRMTGRLP